MTESPKRLLTSKIPKVNERSFVYGFQTEQVALVFVVWCVAFASAMARGFAFVRKRGVGDDSYRISSRVAFACTAGFMAVGYLGCVAIWIGNDWLTSNRFGVAAFASIVGALAPEQHQFFLDKIVNRASKRIDE